MHLQTKLRNKISFIYALFSLLIISILISCGEDRESAQTAPGTANLESFTFFELGTNTKLTDNIRKDLGEKLGRDAIERRSILDLNTNYAGFIKKYLPNINELNRKINFPPGERVEHNTVKLMYRYAQRKNTPFDYVELVFSEYTKTPLLIKINFQIDETGIVETLKTKYGPPQVIDWKEENGKSMVWRKNMDLLLVSEVPDQFGRHGYQIVIYFVQNLNRLIEIEK
ncbi:MAG: hypothetical protein WCB15_08935, partial [Desulfobacterales bacterium]